MKFLAVTLVALVLSATLGIGTAIVALLVGKTWNVASIVGWLSGIAYFAILAGGRREIAKSMGFDRTLADEKDDDFP